MKIVGIILLVILALILFVILSILFVPIRYHMEGSAHDGVYKAKGHVYWLFHMVHGKFNYDQDFTADYGILWKHTDPFSDDEEEEVDEDSNENPSEAMTDSTPVDVVKLDKSIHVDDEEKVTSTESIEEDIEVKSHKESKKKRIKFKKPGIKKKFQEFKGKWNNFKHNFRKYKRMIEDQRNKEAVAHIKKEVFRLLKAVCPKKMKLKAVFSTGSPDTTGQILGILACFPIMYQNRWRISPDFETDHFYIEGDTNISGKIYPYKLIGIAIRLWRDKKCRRLYHQLSK